MGVTTTIILLTDCKNQRDNVHSASPSLAQPRFMPHLSRLREKFNPRTGSSGRDTFAFVPTGHMLADCLTKVMNGDRPRDCMQDGIIDLTMAATYFPKISMG